LLDPRFREKTDDPERLPAIGSSPPFDLLENSLLCSLLLNCQKQPSTVKRAVDYFLSLTFRADVSPQFLV
jgi:hypothetical protein